MRSLSLNPIVVVEVESALQKAIEETYPERAIDEPDMAALQLLQSFLEKPNIRSALHAHLEEKQPRPMNDSLNNLDLKTLDVLHTNAFANNGRGVFNFTYRGVSSRGSHVYDLNSGYLSEERLYIRILDGVLRGEVNEDNFIIKHPNLLSSNEEPISSIGQWLNNWWSEWRKVKF